MKHCVRALFLRHSVVVCTDGTSTTDSPTYRDYAELHASLIIHHSPHRELLQTSGIINVPQGSDTPAATIFSPCKVSNATLAAQNTLWCRRVRCYKDILTVSFPTANGVNHFYSQQICKLKSSTMNLTLLTHK